MAQQTAAKAGAVGADSGRFGESTRSLSSLPMLSSSRWRCWPASRRRTGPSSRCGDRRRAYGTARRVASTQPTPAGIGCSRPDGTWPTFLTAADEIASAAGCLDWPHIDTGP